MPERIDNIYEVEMNDKEMKLYRKLEKEMFLPFADGDIDAVNAASLRINCCSLQMVLFMMKTKM